jgi:hypothetical protein
VVDVVRAGLAQRLRSIGLVGDEVPPEQRLRAGLLLVLSAWAGFAVAGLAFAKNAEHWQAVTPRPDQGVPAAAYDGVVLAAGLGTLAVLLGIALTALPLVAFLRGGGWQLIHRSVLRAACATGLTAAVLLGVVYWAHGLTSGQRNGGDVLYTGAVVVLGLCVVASIGLWTTAAVATASKLALTRTSLRRETFLAGAATVAMAAMTVLATVWWASVPGSSPARMLVLTLLMVTATSFATAGTVRSARALGA